MFRRRTLVASDSYLDEYLTFVAEESGRFKISKAGLSYSLDNGSTWTALAANTNTPTVSAGSSIMWKCNTTPTNGYGVGTFSSTGNFEVEGNPMSLLYGDNFKGQVDLSGKDYVFDYLFQSCTKLISAEKLSLPATTLAIYCYECMFQGCSSLTTAPELPATTLVDGCYKQMFKGCTSLTTAPDLPATTLTIYCYQSMFNGCTSLTTAPSVLPATTLINDCYSSMFQGCTSLTTAPELPATTLEVGCYKQMFYGCTSLSSIKCLATNISANGCTLYWLANVAARGTFTKAASINNWSRNGNGIPSGWTVKNA